MEHGTGLKLASLLEEVDGLDQQILSINREIAGLEGADVAFTELAPYIRRSITPEECTSLSTTRRLRNERLGKKQEKLHELRGKRGSKWAEFLQLLARM